MNRLRSESSPYLLQHQDNPVDWYPWGAEAFQLAAEQDKPIFVSIGYAACHWCHVMAHESFENDDIAALMNELFINVKVDREERPDVDAIYMAAIQIMGQGGGWPLSAFCTPDGTPYFLGTYFPPAEKYGRPGFPRILRTMAEVYRTQRDKVEQNAQGIHEGLRELDSHVRGGREQPLTEDMLIKAGRTLVQKSDPVHGGFGNKPKFPSSSAHELLARVGRLRFGAPARDAFLLQVQRMCRGGIYDHVAGGFARYSVDERWLIPHFEKMLYDNGQLLGIVADAYAMTGEVEYARVIEDTVGWLASDMQGEAGGLFASIDADSEGEEGKYYVWTPEQIAAVLGPADAIVFNAAYGVTRAGNFERGTTNLSRVGPLGAASDEAALAEMRRKLLVARTQRVPPATDTKILASWNALAVIGLVRAWAATDSERAMALARSVGEFLATKMLHRDGTRVWRVYKDGNTKLDGTLDDYAMCAHAFYVLGEASGDGTWWARAERLRHQFMERFYEEVDGVGVFYLVARDATEHLIHRPESHHDGATPAGAAVAIDCLIRAGQMTGDEDALAIAERYLRKRVPQAVDNPFATSRLLASLDLLLNGAYIVFSDGTQRDVLRESFHRLYCPTTLVAGPWAQPSIHEGTIPASDGAARAYVCQGRSCSPPIASASELEEVLRSQDT